MRVMAWSGCGMGYTADGVLMLSRQWLFAAVALQL
jgi:hypothetical protein